MDTSRQVLDAVARALRLDAAAHRHALALAGYAPTGPAAPTAATTTAPAHQPVPHSDPTAPTAARDHQPLLDGWPTTPALLLSPAFDVLAWNQAYATLWPDPAATPEPRRNLLLLLAADPAHHRRLPDWRPLALDLYRHFRTRADLEPPGARAHEVTALLRAACPDLDAWWACRSVGDFTSRTLLLHPESGPPLRYEARLLLTPEPRGGAVLVHTPLARETGGTLPEE
ncbi:hypothetical protein GCM10018785_69210 [Streptomyces longispororuber]|uniref:MmyB-like transcription regulator ligand binding domain-containing protein n=1 Tax=Streptomyces longispororuber TaxID=68230 RepID=A0A919A8R3_9ACTN|nr:XRE family transcriptional regulator [Streptomyces longispororuber]GHE93533.1 hypothetical protein GCM10018785_69210 [Streptomyces longispororuber]